MTYNNVRLVCGRGPATSRPNSMLVQGSLTAKHVAAALNNLVQVNSYNVHTSLQPIRCWQRLQIEHLKQYKRTR